MRCYCHYCFCQEARPSLSDADIEKGVKKTEHEEIRRHYTRQKRCKLLSCGIVSSGVSLTTGASVKSHRPKSFRYKRSLSEEQLLREIIDGKLFGWVQCDIVVPKQLRRCFSSFPPMFKSTVINREGTGTLMRVYAKKDNFMAQPRRMLMLNFHLTNGTLITPLLLFYMKLGLVCKISSLHSKDSEKVFPNLCTVCHECTTSRRWKSSYQRCCWDYETAS